MFKVRQCRCNWPDNSFIFISTRIAPCYSSFIKSSTSRPACLMIALRVPLSSSL